MKRTSDETALMTRYLLGDLSEEEQTRLEERFFADDEAYRQLVALEDELRYDYAQGNLTAGQRVLFEKRFMASAADRQRVELAKAILQKTHEVARQTAEPVARRTWTSALVDFIALRPVSMFSAAVAGAAAICAIVFFTQTIDLKHELARQQNASRVAMNRQKAQDEALGKQLQQERSRREQLEQQSGANKPPSTPLILAFALGPGLTRDTEGLKRLRIPTGADSVRLQLDLKPGDRPRELRAALSNLDGQELWSQDTTPAGSAVVLTLPARILAPGDYVIDLKNRASSDPIPGAQYYFTVVH